MTLKIVSWSLLIFLISIGGRLITNFRFADDSAVNAEEEVEAGVLVDRLDRTGTRYNMEIGPDKTNVMTNNPNGFQRQTKIKGQRLKKWTISNALGQSSLTKDQHPTFFPG